MESLIFLVKKRDKKRVKGRTCRINGNSQQESMGSVEATASTAMTESILIIGVNDANEGLYHYFLTRIS